MTVFAFLRSLLSGRQISVERIRKAVAVGLDALTAIQHRDGSFPMLKQRGDVWVECGPLFSTVSVLLSVGGRLPRDVVAKAIGYVLACRRLDGTWEFDPAYGIPEDSDDTACALAALAMHGESGAVGPQDAAILRSFWRGDDGPFRTWRSDGRWSSHNRDDAVVNCNVLTALNLLGAPASDVELKSVIRLIRRTKRARYYCSPTTVLYAARRSGLQEGSMPPRFLRRPANRTEVLPAAQWLAARRSCDARAVTHILDAQIADGSWPVEAWFTGAGTPRPLWGSPAISTALCVEGLEAALAARSGGLSGSD